MLFMVIERFKQADPTPIGERFRQKGRMLPEGVTYHTSWVDHTGGRCFQVMEAAGLLGCMPGKVKIVGDIESPIPVEWAVTTE